jgi:hypothetical protein
MENIGVLFLLITLTFLVWFWADSLRAREQALRACAKACKQIDAQLLDQTVALRRIRIARNRNGRAVWLRTYRFEYTFDGAQRLRGSAVLRGRTLESLAMDTPQGTMYLH